MDTNEDGQREARARIFCPSVRSHSCPFVFIRGSFCRSFFVPLRALRGSERPARSARHTRAPRRASPLSSTTTCLRPGGRSSRRNDTGGRGGGGRRSYPA